MDIFLLLPLQVGVLINFISYFYFSFLFNFSGCDFKISFSLSWVATLGIRVILPLIINNFNIIGYTVDRILSTTPGAEPPRDARDSGSARSHSTHLETSSSNRP